MTPDEKAIIDAKREAYAAGAQHHCIAGCTDEALRAEAEAKFPYTETPTQLFMSGHPRNPNAA